MENLLQNVVSLIGYEVSNLTLIHYSPSPIQCALDLVFNLVASLPFLRLGDINELLSGDC